MRSLLPSRLLLDSPTLPRSTSPSPFALAADPSPKPSPPARRRGLLEPSIRGAAPPATDPVLSSPPHPPARRPRRSGWIEGAGGSGRGHTSPSPRPGDGAGVPEALRCLLRQQGDAGTLPPLSRFPFPLPDTGHGEESGGSSVSRSAYRCGRLRACRGLIVALISLSTELVVNHVFRQQSASSVLVGNHSLASKGRGNDES